MTVEDRLRATTEAVTAAMRPIRPLDLSPGKDRAQAPGKRSPARRPRRRAGWLIPLAAAMAVIAVAATLVAVRSLSTAGTGSRSTPATRSSSPAALFNGVPRYYVAFSSASTYFDNRTARTASLGDAKTGKRLASFSAPPGAIFTWTAASADDKTFVLLATPGAGGGASGPATSSAKLAADVWYSLRLAPGASGPPRLARIPIASSAFTAANVAVKGFAVSPDGRTLAVLTQAVTGNVPKVAAGPVTLRTYSLATGQPLRAWPAPANTTSSATFTDLTWLDDGHTLAFAVDGHNLPYGVHTLNIDSPGTSLLADSRLVFHGPGAFTCDGGMLLTADGKAVICGSVSIDTNACAAGHLELAAYSVATGKLERVLYRYRGDCLNGVIRPEWAGSATHAIALVSTLKSVNPPLAPDTLVVTNSGTSASPPITLQGGGLFYSYDVAF